MRFDVTSIKERLAIGEPLTADECSFVLDCINEATRLAATTEVHFSPNYLGRIEALYAALSIDDGGEGVCAAPLGNSGITAALVGADKIRFDKYLRPMAQRIATMFGKPVRIAKFTRREDIEIFQP